MEQFEKQNGLDIAAIAGSTVKKMGLRFDGVVLRLLRDIRQSVVQHIPDGMAVIMTNTAPIRFPAKTALDAAEEIRQLLNAGNSARHKTLTIWENKVQLKIVKASAKHSAEFVGLVHNPDIDTNILLNAAAQYLLQK